MAGRSSTKSRSAISGKQSGLFPEDSKGVAKTYSLPTRFKALSVPAKNAFTLLDTESGKEVEVPMAAYGEVQRVLGALFGGKLIDVVDSDVELPEAAPEKTVEGTGIVKIPAPEKRIFGGALAKYVQKWLKENGYPVDAQYELEKKENIPQEGDPTVEVAVSEQSASVVWSMDDIKSGDDTEELPIPPSSSAVSQEAEKPKSKSKVADSKAPASSHEWTDQEFDKFSLKVNEVDGKQGYDVVVGNKVIGRVELGPKGKFHVTFPSGDYENSAHTNMTAVTIKLNVALAN